MLFTLTPKTRSDRAEAVKVEKLGAIQADLKQLLISILDAYTAKGESELASQKLGQFITARYGGVGEAKRKLGALPEIKQAFRNMQAELYSK